MSLEVIIVQGAGVEFSDLIRKYKEVPEDLYQLAQAHDMRYRGLSWVEFEGEIFFYYPLLSPILDPNYKQTFHSVEEMKLNIAAEILEFLHQKVETGRHYAVGNHCVRRCVFRPSLNEIYYP